MRSLSSSLLVLAALVPASIAGSALPDTKPVGLRPLDFTAAQVAAQGEKRPMLVLFCDGEKQCASISTSVLKEVKLRQWLDATLVAIQVDKSAETELAAKYRVRATPTYLFLDAKGVEIDRLLGPRDSKALRAEGEELLKGGDPLERLQKRRQGRESDPEMRLRYADILFDRGDLDAAMAEYLTVNASGGPMGAAAFDELLRLARVYPRAADAIAGIAAGLEPRIHSAAATDEDFERWFGLCRRLRLETRMLLVYDALAPVEAKGESDRARNVRAAALRARIAPALRDLFYTDQRYSDVATLIEDSLGDFEERKTRHAQTVAAGDATATKTSSSLLRADTARDYEALVAVRRLGEATLLADALVNFDPTVATYDALIENADRAGAKGEAKMLALRGRADARIDAKLRMRIGPTVPHQVK